MTAALEPGASPRPGLPRAVSRVTGGIGAVGVKELRGRMRGRRAFVVLTVYLALLATFAWMVELFFERQYSQSFGGFTYASAEIGKNVFFALLLLETLLVCVLAPASTSGAISQEREKQTFDLLAATPIGSLAIVVGKLFSALTYVLLLILASLPLTALVFVFGGVAPDDVIRGYVVLLVTAIGLGSVGLFFSVLVRRTQAATILAYVTVLAITIGSFLLWGFWSAMSSQAANPAVRDAGGGVVQPQRAPEVLLWLNPFIAQADVMCGVETSYSGTCALISEITGRSTIFTGIQPMPAPGVAIDVGGRITKVVGADGGPVQVGQAWADVVGDPAPDAFGVIRDAFWPRFTVAWLVLSVALVVISVQLVAPTRRWRLRRPGRAIRSARSEG